MGAWTKVSGGSGNYGKVLQPDSGDRGPGPKSVASRRIARKFLQPEPGRHEPGPKSETDGAIA